jgi:hypothetical protein
MAKLSSFFDRDFHQDIFNSGLYSSIIFSQDQAASKIELTVNNDRIQCLTCFRCYPGRASLDHHLQHFPKHCAACKMCFGNDDVVVHAMQHAHDRCFVEGCRSKKREVAGWDKTTIELHVKKHHGFRPEPEDLLQESQLPAYSSLIQSGSK